MGAVGRDIPHDSAVGHVSGRSPFIDDIAPQRGELIVGLVGSAVAHGRLRMLDISAAAAVPGVVTILTARDVRLGHNRFGPVIHDEDLLVEDEAMYVGHPVALIAAENPAAINAARKLIRMEIDPLPPIFSIEDAIAAESFIGPVRTIARGEVDGAMASAQMRVEGEVILGGQEHFYLESQSALAYPGENGQMMILSSTQHPSEVQMLVADFIGVPFNHVVVQCRRMGGGFGGKETQAAQPAMMAALVAQRTGRPARLVFDKDLDMAITGKRHPFKINYRAGFTQAGLLTALDVTLYANGGCSADLSMAVFERALLHSDNAYFIPHFRTSGRICKTNLPSNTAFRGFGGPQGVAAIEHVIEHVAASLGMDALDVRQLNAYGSQAGAQAHGQENLQTPYGQIVANNMLPRLFADLRESCEYDKRRARVERFNRQSQTTLRGLAMTAVKFGISFTRRTLNQANALVNLYQDGTVLVSTGATEMGQGVNTRVRQVVADELGVSYDAVLVTATSTDKNNNTSPTAASSGTDLNGAAAADACRKLRARLGLVAAAMLARPGDGLAAEVEHVVFENGSVYDGRRPTDRLTFRQVVLQAYEQRINLGERGFYATPGVDYNRETGRGNPFLYFTNGVACAEVAIDRFTGQMHVVRVDLLMDAGVPLNPGIDRGQIIGGFVQGMGWCTTEKLEYSPAGVLLSHSPTTYKIPNVSDVPRVFNVAFLDNPDNVVSLRRSKALGEPPLLLGLAVWAAAKNALRSATGGHVRVDLPATGEELLLRLEAATQGGTGQGPATGASLVEARRT